MPLACSRLTCPSSSTPPSSPRQPQSSAGSPNRWPTAYEQSASSRRQANAATPSSTAASRHRALHDEATHSASQASLPLGSCGLRKVCLSCKSAAFRGADRIYVPHRANGQEEGRSRLATSDLTLQHPQLMAQKEDLDLLLPLRAPPKHDQLQE